MTDRNSIYVFLRIMHRHNGIRYAEKIEEENLGAGMVAEAEEELIMKFYMTSD